MDEVLAIVRTTLQEIGVSVTGLERSQRLEDDLGVESLGRIELAMKLQKRFKKPVVDHIDDLKTVEDLLTFLSAS